MPAGFHQFRWPRVEGISVPKHSDKLDQVIGEDVPFWEFYILFNPLKNQSHPDLPQLSSSSIVPDIHKLFEIFSYCYQKEQEPSEVLLMEAMKFGSPLVEKLDVYSEPLSKHLRDCFNAAMQKLRIDEHIQEVVKESTDTPGEPARPVNTSASPENQDIKAQQADSIRSESSTSRRETRRFRPGAHGGKEICIIVSYHKAGNRNTKKLAMALTHKAHTRYPSRSYSYKTPFAWYENDRKGFNNHTYKMREKAKSEGWWDNIPADYHLKYTAR